MKQLIPLFVISLLIFSCKKENPRYIQSSNKEVNDFQTSFGGASDDFGTSIIEVNGNLYLYGTSKSFGEPNGDFYLVKSTPKGEKILEKTLGSNAAEEASKIISTSDGNLLLIGWTKNTNSGNKSIYLVKTDLDGNLIWEKTYGGTSDDFPNDILELENNQYLITGATTSFGEGSSDIYLLWIDGAGNLLKEVFHGDIDQDGGTQTIELPNGKLMMYGYTWNYGATSRDYYLLKMNSNGDSLWSKRYGGASYEETHAFARTSTGEFIMNGHSASTDPIHNMLGVKVDSLGNVIWEKNFGGAAHDGGTAFLINSRGEYVFVARSMSFEANQNIFISVTEPNGNLIKDQYIGLSMADMANDIIEYDGHYYFLGQTNSIGAGGLDFYLYCLNINN